VCGDEDPPSSLFEVVKEKGSDLHLLFRDFGYSENPTGWAFWNLDGCRLNLPSLPVVGTHQLANASVAVEVVQLLRSRLPVDNGAMRTGLVSCRSIGRIQILPLKPMIILDVAHNIASVKELVAYLDQTSFSGKTHVIFGVLTNKKYKEMVTLLDGVADRWMFCTLKSSRGLGPDISLSALREYNHEKEAQVCESVSDALDSALKSSDANDRIIVCGSFVTVSEAFAHPLLSDMVSVS
jgi:dihydrofolate synthase/folylpolyglutamate synthase